jgi:hypothetical protein
VRVHVRARVVNGWMGGRMDGYKCMREAREGHLHTRTLSPTASKRMLSAARRRRMDASEHGAVPGKTSSLPMRYSCCC